MPGERTTYKEIILCILVKAGREKQYYEKNELIMHIYFKAKRKGIKLKISTIDRYLRDFVSKRLLWRFKVKGETRYHIIVSNVVGVIGGKNCNGVWMEGSASAYNRRVHSGLLVYV